MTHVVRAWRTSRTVRLLVLVALFGTATQLVLSQDSRVVQNGARQTKRIGADRLVSIEPLPQMDGPMCEIDEAHGAETMIAAAAAPRSLALLQQARPGAAPSPSTASRPSDALKAEIAKGKPIGTMRDPRNAFASLVIDATRNEVIFADENNFSVL